MRVTISNNNLRVVMRRRNGKVIFRNGVQFVEILSDDDTLLLQEEEDASEGYFEIK